MCYIPKVASSTWIAHFANIQDGKPAFVKKKFRYFTFSNCKKEE